MLTRLDSNQDYRGQNPADCHCPTSQCITIGCRNRTGFSAFRQYLHQEYEPSGHREACLPAHLHNGTLIPDRLPTVPRLSLPPLPTSPLQGSNLRPALYKSAALPTELSGHGCRGRQPLTENVSQRHLRQAPGGGKPRTFPGSPTTGAVAARTALPYPRRDSNPHCRRPQRRASCHWATRT